MDADLAARAIARALVLPPLGPLLVAAAGLALAVRRPRLGRCLVAGALALLGLLSLPVVAGRLAAAAGGDGPTPDAAALAGAAAIVVLSGGIRPPAADRPATPSPATLERLAAGAALARTTGLPLVLSGGTVDGGPPEAEVMQRALREDFGLAAAVLERRSRTTQENAVETARLAAAYRWRRVVLVTSALHLPRARREFEAAGLEVVGVPAGPPARGGGRLTDWLPRPSALELSYEALYEVCGRLVARLAGRG